MKILKMAKIYYLAILSYRKKNNQTIISLKFIENIN